MESPELLARSRTLAKISVAGAAVLAILVLLTPIVVSHAALPDAIFFLWALFLLLAALLLGISLAYVFMTRGTRQGPPDASATRRAPAQGVPQGSTVTPDQVLAFLTGDERSLYRRILATGGSVLQKDLVGTSGFSGSKLSRLLDRLEAKGLLTRERHGMTNRVRLSDAWRERR